MARRGFTLNTFRSRLTLLIGGLSLLTMLSVGIYVGQMATQQVSRAAAAQIQSTAQAAAGILGTNLRERELEIALLSMAPHFSRGDLRSPELLASLKRRQGLRQEYAWLGVADAQGQVLQAIDGMLEGQSVAQRPWFVAALRGVFVGDVHEALLLSKLLPQATAGEPLRFIDFAAPIHDRQGKVIGVLGAHGHWRWVTQTVQAALDQRGLGEAVEILIVDKAGTVLYPQALADRLKVPAGLNAATTATLLRWEDGVDYLSGAAAVRSGTRNELGWRIVVRQAAAQALAPAHQLRDRLLVLGLLAGLVFTIGALYLARSISKPIEQLAEAARRIEARDGEPRYPAADGLLEIEQLSQSIRSMTASLLGHERELELLNQGLEQQVQQRTEALAEANRALERLATRDGLTGLSNRRRFDERLAECFHAARRSGRGFTLLVLDADHFKSINDRHGHLIGDQVLQQLAQLLTHSIRACDFVARYGGEEFVILLPETPDCDVALVVAEKVRQAVAAATFPAVGRLTVSLGLSAWSPADTAPADIVQRADRALYAAKAAGRNQSKALV